MTDHGIAWLGLGITIAGVAGTWLGLPQIQSWWQRRAETNTPITLGSLAGASKLKAVPAPGMIRADQEVLKDIQAGLPSRKVEWLHHQNFGDGFWLSEVTNIEHFVLSRSGPEHEFLNPELEQLRSALWKKVDTFTGLIAGYTFSSGGRGEKGNTWMRIPRDEYDENGNYTNRYFFQKTDELNAAAEDVWNSYKELVRRARLLLASGEAPRVEE